MIEPCERQPDWFAQKADLPYGWLVLPAVAGNSGDVRYLKR